VAVLGILVSVAIAFGPRPGGIFPGYIFTADGLGQTDIAGHKVPLFGPVIFGAIEAITILTVLLALMWHRSDWDLRVIGRPGALLVLCSAAQFLAILYEGQALDRYYLVLVAPLLPIVAAAASRAEWKPWLGRGWAMASLVGALGIYAAGEQDYIAAREARALAAQQAYQQVTGPWQVDAGKEENDAHVYIPAIDDPAQQLPGVIDNPPALKLAWAPAGDPRPGATYSSLAPGRVIIVPGDASSP
jgi:hypothetical protein